MNQATHIQTQIREGLYVSEEDVYYAIQCNWITLDQFNRWLEDMRNEAHDYGYDMAINESGDLF